MIQLKKERRLQENVAGAMQIFNRRISLLLSQPAQCLKWRLPVKIIAILCLSAVAMTSSSFFEPPG